MTVDLPVLRTSERAIFKRCPWRWWQEFRMGYRPRGIQADALWLGVGIHIALAAWYQPGKKRGRHPAETFAEWCGSEIAYAKTYLDETFDDAVWYDAKELGIAMLDGYVEHYGKDQQWHVIATEQPFAVKLFRLGEPVAIFKSRWDGVVRSLVDGRIYLVEHKTASQIMLPYLEMDDQGGSYWAVASQVLRAKGILKPKEDIAGIIYNFLRKAMPDERPQNGQGLYLNKPTKEHYVAALIGVDGWTEDRLRKLKVDDLDSVAAANYLVVEGDISKSQPPPRYVREIIERSRIEQRTQLDRIADEVTVMNAVRDGTIPLTKTPTKDCPRCPFWMPCQLHERGSLHAFQEVLQADYIQEDPYLDDQKSAATTGA